MARYTKQQIATEAGVSLSALKKYIWLRLVDPAEGSGSARYFTDHHLDQARTLREDLAARHHLPRISCFSLREQQLRLPDIAAQRRRPRVIRISR